MLSCLKDWLFTTPLKSFLIAQWSWLSDFLDSNFFSALLGALAGALAAQKISEKGKVRSELMTEMRINNSALIHAFGIVNSVINAKSQHLREIKAEFDRNEDIYNLLLLKKRLNEVDTQNEIHIPTDFTKLQKLDLSVQILNSYIYEKLSIEPWGLMLTGSLNDCLLSLDYLIDQRNEFIEKFKDNSTFQKYKVEYYFGRYIPALNFQDASYPSLLEGLIEKADEAIFFGVLLIEILKLHGAKLNQRYKDTFKENGLKPVDMNFDIAAKKNLMPHPLNYIQWLHHFHSRSSLQNHVESQSQ